MRALNVIERISKLLNRVGAVIAVLLIIYMLGHILLEIALRLFGHSTFILDEYIGYAVATMSIQQLGNGRLLCVALDLLVSECSA